MKSILIVYLIVTVVSVISSAIIMKEVYVGFALTGVPQQESFSFFTLLQQDSTADHLLKYYEGDKELVKAKIKNLKQIPYVPFLPSDFTLYDEDGEIAEMRCVKDKKELNSVNSHIENTLMRV
jgi:hypothetical protein